jgi:hypothetical protein
MKSSSCTSLGESIVELGEEAAEEARLLLLTAALLVVVGTKLTTVTVDVAVRVETDVAVIVAFGTSPTVTNRLAEINTPAMTIAAAMAR